MDNIRQYILSVVQQAYNNHYKLIDGIQYINVFSTNNCYTIKSMIGLERFLALNNITVTHENLFNELTSLFDKNMFEFKLNKNEICVYLSNPYTQQHIIKLFDLKNILQHTYIKSDNEVCKKKLKILVDFSSPNIAKDMHVGHLRSTIIGDSICKFYESQGHEVHRINHIGDWGLQFGMIIQHLLEQVGKDEYKKANLSISDLQIFYAQSKKRFDTDDEFKKNAYQKVVMLQSGDKEITEAWEFIKEISRQSYIQIYDKLNIQLTEVGESFYQPMVKNLVNELQDAGILEEDNGRKVINIPGYDLPLTVIKSDGGVTYDTTDLAALKYRLVDINMDKVFYVVDNGQSLHFDLVFGVAKIMGWLKPHQEIKHIGFGVVLDQFGKKFKSRSGDTVKLIDLLDESIEKASQVLVEHTKESDITLEANEKDKIIKHVAYSSIKYADLSTPRTTDYKFSFDKMINFKGNTGAWQLYQYVRINAILRNAGNVHVTTALENVNDFKINEPEEKTVCNQILIFPEILDKIDNDLMFHVLCDYLLELTETFSKFHKKCRCLHYNENKELISVDHNKLLICIATHKIMTQCFDILGLMPLDRM